MKKEFYRFLLEKIEKEGALAKNLVIEDLAQYKETLELIFTILTPLMANEKELYWALSTPVPDQIFFSTDLLYNFIQKHVAEKELDAEHRRQKEKDQVKFIYNVILKRYYNYTALTTSGMRFAYNNPQTGLTQYFNVNVDTQFVDISYNKAELPTLNFEQFSGFVNDEHGMELLHEILPLHMMSEMKLWPLPMLNTWTVYGEEQLQLKQPMQKAGLFPLHHRVDGYLQPLLVIQVWV